MSHNPFNNSSTPFAVQIYPDHISGFSILVVFTTRVDRLTVLKLVPCQQFLQH